MKIIEIYLLAWGIVVSYAAMCFAVSLAFFLTISLTGEAEIGADAFWSILYGVLAHPFV